MTLHTCSPYVASEAKRLGIGRVYRSHDEEIAAAREAIKTLPPVAVSLAATKAHLARIDLRLAHESPCRLPMHDCPICDDAEWHRAHAEPVT
jgi:hypothetical protein